MPPRPALLTSNAYINKHTGTQIQIGMAKATGNDIKWETPLKQHIIVAVRFVSKRERAYIRTSAHKQQWT
jgi:hypothetical protein